jgi:alkylation response protein AidB-like acyl-CoA dehydrogenase
MIELQREQNGFAALPRPSLSMDQRFTSVLVEEPSPNSAKSAGRLALATGELRAKTRLFADEIAARPNHGETSAPLDDVERLSALGLLTAPLPVISGGLGLGTEAGGHLVLLQLLAAIGGGDLVLGRLYEGHVNALMLIAAYGTPLQLSRAAQDARKGLLFGVWNTGGSEPLRLNRAEGEFHFRGVKTFASGAPFVLRPIVTADFDGQGWQMTLPRMDSPEIRCAVTRDPQLWHPLGMEGSESYGIDFTGAAIRQDDLIGKPGDFYRDPLFRGGAIRFAAVHVGAVLRLHRMFAEWLESKGRGGDPYQVARLGEVAIEAQEAVLWVERAASVAEDGLSLDADKLAAERTLECANMTRVAIERLATSVMQRVVAGIGAHGLLQPSRFERIVRDLTMYLRQPAPDHTLAEVGRASLRKSHLRADGAGNGIWSEPESEGSLPATYFRQIYERSIDPWNFESSKYEADKYRETLDSLPQENYRSALEIGCSIGVFTQQLASRCDVLLSIDVSERALAVARQRCAALPQVRFACLQVPQAMPEGTFDLIMVSEVAYYWNRRDLERAMSLIAAHQQTGAHLVLVHHTDAVPDYPLTGDEVHELWLARTEWTSIYQRRAKGYRLDVLERC